MSAQLALEFDAKHNALCFVWSRPDLFRKDFAHYLEKNFHVYQAFDEAANAVWNRGRRHYSQRTIVEVLRHESALRENPAGELKLNDKWTKDLARLWVCHHPERSSFFEFRNCLSLVREGG